MVGLGAQITGHPRAAQVLLDGAFVVLAVATFGQVWDPDVLFHGIWVVLTLEAFLFGLRGAVVRIVAAMVLLMAYFEVAASQGPGDAAFLELDLAEWPLMVVIAITVAVMADRVASTGRHYAELYRRASDRLLTAQEDERRRLGMDLHDGVGQTLTAIVLTLDATEQQLWAGQNQPSTLGRSGMARVQELAATALDETHDVAYRLRPARFAETGLVAALKRLANTAGVPIDVTWDPNLDRSGLIAPEDEMSVYRVVQEALSNAIRYAGAAHIRLDVGSDGDRLSIRVTDDGIGFDPSTEEHRGLGLAGMRERALVMQGELQIDSALGKGTTILLRVPMARRTSPPLGQRRLTRAQVEGGR